jgi:hypothetical protein
MIKKFRHTRTKSNIAIWVYLFRSRQLSPVYPEVGQVHQEPSMPTKARAAATDAREDILSPAAMNALSPGVVSAMGTVGAAVLKMHREAMDKKPDWFWHLFAKCEAKAARLAEQATHGPHACGDATFIEVYAKTLPGLVTKALETQASKH